MCVASVGSATALAADWSEILPADAVDSYLPGEDLSIMVVAAGDEAECETAAQALTVALNSADKAKVVMPDDSLGDIAALGDADIVAQATKLPVDLVAVARVFPAGDDLYSLVTTLYDKQGEVAGAFTATNQEALVAQAGQAASGVTSAAADAVSAIAGHVAEDQEAAWAEFEERFVWFQGMASVNASTGTVVSTWSVPYKGKYKEPLNGADFYSYLGREDYAETYRKRARNGTLLVTGTLALAGAGVMFHVADIDPISPNKPVAFVLYGLAGVGLVGSAFVEPTHPVDEPDRLRMVEEFNKNLAEELGLEPVSQGVEPMAAEPDFSLAVAPYAAPGGGGLAVGLTF